MTDCKIFELNANGEVIDTEIVDEQRVDEAIEALKYFTKEALAILTNTLLHRIRQH